MSITISKSFKMESSVANSSGAMPGPSGEVSEVQEPPENPLLLADEQKLVEIEKPHHNDVLCGRGVTTNRHIGNENFRSLVGLNKVNKIPYSIHDCDSYRSLGQSRGIFV